MVNNPENKPQLSLIIGRGNSESLPYLETPAARFFRRSEERANLLGKGRSVADREDIAAMSIFVSGYDPLNPENMNPDDGPNPA